MLGDGCWMLGDDDVWGWMMGDECWVLMMMCGFTMNFIETINTHHPPPNPHHPPLIKIYWQNMQSKRGDGWKNELFKSLRKFFVIK